MKKVKVISIEKLENIDYWDPPKNSGIVVFYSCLTPEVCYEQIKYYNVIMNDLDDNNKKYGMICISGTYDGGYNYVYDLPNGVYNKDGDEITDKNPLSKIEVNDILYLGGIIEKEFIKANKNIIRVISKNSCDFLDECTCGASNKPFDIKEPYLYHIE